MRNKILCSLLICTLVCASVGCGKGEVIDTPTPDTQEVVEETTEAESDSETVGYVIPDKEAKTEEVEEAFEFTEEYALEKVKRAISAYEDILKSHDNYSINMCSYTDSADINVFETLTTSDGYLICDPESSDLDGMYIVSNSAVMSYYDNYINHDGNYYSIAEYVEQHTKDEILSSTYYLSFDKNGIYNTNDYYLRGLTIIPRIIYMHPNTISTDEVLDRSEIESIDAFPKGCYRSSKDDFVEYDHVVSIVIDGDHINRFAAFDSEGNLVNFVDCDEYNYNPDTKFTKKTVYDLVEIQ